MPQFQQGMYYVPDYAPNDQVAVANQQDLDNLIAAGINVQTPTNTTTPSSSTTTPPDYNQQAEDLLGGGFQSSTTVEDIRAQERARREAIAAQAESIFGPRFARAEELGRQNISSGKAQVGTSRGLGLSSAENSYISSIQKDVDDRLNEITAAKASYIQEGNFNAAQWADAAIEKLQDAKNNFILNKANLAIQLMQVGQNQSKINWDIVSNLGEGKSYTDPVSGQVYKGVATSEVDPFFSGSDIISLMKTLPSGTTQTLTDPNTGEKYTITGLSTDDPTMKTIQSTDGSGNVTITSYRLTDKGAEIINAVSAGRVGKPNQGISINLPSYSVITDPKTGQPRWKQVIDKNTGNITYQDLSTGETVDPSQVQTEEGPDPFDTYLNDIFGEIMGE